MHGAPGAPTIPLRTVSPTPGPPPLGDRPLTNAARARFLVHALLVDARAARALVGTVEANVDEQVVVWGPADHTTSRTELIAALLESDDAIADIEVSIVGESTIDSTSCIEWRATGRFDNAAFVGDDVLVEPSGRAIEAAGVMICRFVGSRASHISCYYDRLALVEQLFPPAALRFEQVSPSTASGPEQGFPPAVLGSEQVLPSTASRPGESP